jgi:phage tail sheath protein FI
MPAALSYPGVYIEEIASGVRTITGVPTSIAAFVGRAARGPTNKATTINGFGDFERVFGGLWLKSQLGYAVRDFFLNGGGQAIIVRLYGPNLSDADLTKVETATTAVSTAAATGTDHTSAAAKAAAKAAEFTAEPEKSAAAAVAKAADEASKLSGATKDKVVAAAKKAAKDVAPASKAILSVGGFDLVAASEGTWGANLRAIIDKSGITDDVALGLGVPKTDLFNLTVRDTGPGGASERYANLTITESARRIDRVLEAESGLVRCPALPSALPAGDDPVGDAVWTAEKTLADAKAALTQAKLSGDQTAIDDAVTARAEAETAATAARNDATDAVSDGGYLKATDFLPANGETDKRGLHALEQADLFNLLCIPPYASSDGGVSFEAEPIVVSAATAYCEKRRAIHLIDPPLDWRTKDDAKTKIADFPEARSKNAALYFPRLMQPNLLRENRIEAFAPCGAVAGVIARTDTQRGVWKAPAGLDSTLTGVPKLAVNLTDAENGELNPLGINCLRAFPAAGRVVWGSRTLRGADQLADEWKYLPVRRTALFIEESLYRGTQWVVFEPNDEPLWSQIRLNVGAFMQGLFRQGAFQGQSPRDAYFVKCDKETTTQADINLGIVNIAVGFAPLKPAEFVVIRLQQIAGQIQT